MSKQPIKIQAGRFYKIASSVFKSAEKLEWSDFHDVPTTRLDTIQGYPKDHWYVTESGKIPTTDLNVEYECDSTGQPIEHKDEKPVVQPIERQTALPPSREQVWIEACFHCDEMNTRQHISGKATGLDGAGVFKAADLILSEYDKRFSREAGK